MSERPVYIVTGGAGFIGSNLVAALLSKAPRPYVVVIDNFRSGSFANIVEACARRGVGPFDGKVIPRSTAGVRWSRVREYYGPSAVFHLAAITDTTVSDETEMIRQNVAGFTGLLESCRGWGPHKPIPIVYASSAATYGTPSQAADRTPFPVEAAGEPNNVYGFSKWLMENEQRLFEEATRVPDVLAPRVVGLRYFNVFGPGESRKGKMASMAYQLAHQMLAGRRPRLFHDGSQARDQVYIDDVVECTLAGAGLGKRSNPASGIYNLGSGVATSFGELAAAVRRGLGLSEEQYAVEYFPMPPAVRAFYQDYTCADMSRTQDGLGFAPAHKPLVAAERYAAWLAAHAPRPADAGAKQ